MSGGSVERQLRTGSWGLDSYSQADLLRTDKETTEMLRHRYSFGEIKIYI